MIKKYLVKMLWLSLLLICFGLFVANLVVAMNWLYDGKKIGDEIEETKIPVFEETGSETIEIINPPKSMTSEYWKYLQMPLMEVDLKSLIKTNSDTVGFISIEGTNINYPVVQAKDNDYYLTHSFQKKYNQAGWIFMDYRNKPDFSDPNTIIYGHSQVDKTMFGTLKNILSSNWLKDKNNYIIRYVTLTETMLFQVFSIYIIPVESYYIENTFSSTEYHKNWLKTMVERSEHDFKTEVNEEDKVITLSTCKGNGNHRVVMQAKLIKKDQHD